jgi:SAM-dependent methyltransferase
VSAGERRTAALQRLTWAFARVLLRSVGRASDGLRLCFDEGLTSGAMLDYVYRNQPSGRWVIGRAIDRVFLSSPGWEAVRARRRHLESLLGEALAALRAEGRPVSLLDVASGPAAYVLAVLERQGAADVFARCRDLEPRWLEQGAAEAARRGLAGVRFERGDALDREGILALRPRPNLAVASGFYDWITDDATVRRSIAILAEVLEPGGRFVLTNQSAHPDLAFTTAVFTSFNHEPLRMKMRPASTIDSWLVAAGLRVERSLTDPHGYYSVTLARKP